MAAGNDPAMTAPGVAPKDIRLVTFRSADGTTA